jgi:very-short-patch-repair endonuclease
MLELFGYAVLRFPNERVWPISAGAINGILALLSSARL